MNSIFTTIAAHGAHCFHDLVDLLFPPSCLSCGVSLLQSSILFCESCRKKIKFVTEPYCTCCGALFPSGENHLCGICMVNKWSFTKARSVIVYNETAAKAILGLKFGGRKAGLKTFKKMKDQNVGCQNLLSPDSIVPVPLHMNRLRQRGFNQSLLLAMVFFPDQRKKIKKTLLKRQRDTVPQTGLTGLSRRKNLRDAFEVEKTDDVYGKKILLIDDVFTTGTTVNECAKVLKKAGAERVDVLTLARVAKF